MTSRTSRFTGVLVILLYMYVLSPSTQGAVADAVKRLAFDHSIDTIVGSRPVLGAYISAFYF